MDSGPWPVGDPKVGALRQTILFCSYLPWSARQLITHEQSVFDQIDISGDTFLLNTVDQDPLI